MKLTKQRLTQIIKEELENFKQEESLGTPRPPKDSSAGRPTRAGKAFGYSDDDAANIGKYNMLNGYLAFVDENGKVNTVDLTGPNGESYYYADDYEAELKKAGYERDENLTVPHPGASGRAHQGSGAAKYGY